MPLSDEERAELLLLARKTLESYLREKKIPHLSILQATLQARAGAFVTLEKKGQLRGCIGHMAADKPLFLTVQEMAVQAATGDPRFPAVRAEELDQIEIEISVLSPFRRLASLADLEEIKIGEHGLVVEEGIHRGVLLPQVAVREGWNREEFLGYTCLKAGLPFNSWRSGHIQIEIFSAEVFSEKTPNS